MATTKGNAMRPGRPMDQVTAASQQEQILENAPERKRVLICQAREAGAGLARARSACCSMACSCILAWTACCCAASRAAGTPSLRGPSRVGEHIGLANLWKSSRSLCGSALRTASTTPLDELASLGRGVGAMTAGLSSQRLPAQCPRQRVRTAGCV